MKRQARKGVQRRVQRLDGSAGKRRHTCRQEKAREGKRRAHLQAREGKRHKRRAHLQEALVSSALHYQLLSVTVPLLSLDPHLQEARVFAARGVLGTVPHGEAGVGGAQQHVEVRS